ncbi:RrF2 family transcriptional regulator [Sediminibacillus albus]|uniref:RrF2 family transcriptional regulator n=1 Tax=Sediminibacillus albus TaxID=407036 RepID=UPI003CCC05F6
MKLARHPDDIQIGEVVRNTEEDFFVVECFDDSKNTCLISDACRLQGVLGKALTAFMETLDQYKLGDLIINKDHLQSLMTHSASADNKP